MNPEPAMSDPRDRTYCREHCKGFRESGGRCFADGECEDYTKHMKKQQKHSPKGVSGEGAPSISAADVDHYADVVEAVFVAENKVLPEWRERLQQAPTLNSADRLHLARDYTRAIAREILENQTIDE